MAPLVFRFLEVLTVCATITVIASLVFSRRKNKDDDFNE